jgi:prephenate dehydrogenase
MQIKEIAIIGANGKMGSWFTNYFLKKYDDLILSVYDVRKSLPFSNKIRIADDIGDCVRTADIVIICVPVQHIPDVIKECASKMIKPHAVLAEISSVKNKTFDALRKIQLNIQPLCIHPMFGQGANIDGNLKMLLIPVRDKEKEESLLKSIFVKSTLSIKILNDPLEHDKYIALVLGLTYFTNIVFAKVLADEKIDISLLKEIAGTTFGLQLLLSESVLTDELNLISALILENPEVSKLIRNHLAHAKSLSELIIPKSKKEDRKVELEKSVKKTIDLIEKKEDLKIAYLALYSLIEVLRQSKFMSSDKTTQKS